MAAFGVHLGTCSACLAVHKVLSFVIRKLLYYITCKILDIMRLPREKNILHILSLFASSDARIQGVRYCVREFPTSSRLDLRLPFASPVAFLSRPFIQMTL